jgi:hypothetical protein
MPSFLKINFTVAGNSYVKFGSISFGYSVLAYYVRLEINHFNLYTLFYKRYIYVTLLIGKTIIFINGFVNHVLCTELNRTLGINKDNFINFLCLIF